MLCYIPAKNDSQSWCSVPHYTQNTHTKVPRNSTSVPSCTVSLTHTTKVPRNSTSVPSCTVSLQFSLSTASVTCASCALFRYLRYDDVCGPGGVRSSTCDGLTTHSSWQDCDDGDLASLDVCDRPHHFLPLHRLKTSFFHTPCTSCLVVLVGSLRSVLSCMAAFVHAIVAVCHLRK